MVNEQKLSKAIDREFCRVCIRAKQSRLPFKGERTRASRPIALIHTNICGPINTPTWNGKNYFITFIDDFTHFTVIYLLSNKNETFELFKKYIATVETQFGTKVFRLRCYKSRENTSNAIKKFCVKKGIQTEFTVPYTPEQNGHADLIKKTLVEKGRALLLQSSFSKEIWGEAVMIATYLTNRLPSYSIFNKTPAELQFGKRPNVSNLKFFGFTVHLHLPKQIRTKFDSKSR